MSALGAAAILAGFWALCGLGTIILRRVLDRTC